MPHAGSAAGGSARTTPSPGTSTSSNTPPTSAASTAARRARSRPSPRFRRWSGSRNRTCRRRRPQPPPRRPDHRTGRPAGPAPPLAARRGQAGRGGDDPDARQGRGRGLRRRAGGRGLFGRFPRPDPADVARFRDRGARGGCRLRHGRRGDDPPPPPLRGAGRGDEGRWRGAGGAGLGTCRGRGQGRGPDRRTWAGDADPAPARRPGAEHAQGRHPPRSANTTRTARSGPGTGWNSANIPAPISTRRTIGCRARTTRTASPTPCPSSA
jgi:hypothetical protein